MDAAKGLLVLFVAAALNSPSVLLAQSGWSGGTSAPSAQAMYDRYGQPIAQRAQTAVSETGSALSDSFNAGVKAAENSIKNWSNQSTASTSAPSWSNTQPAAPAAPSWPSSQPATSPTARTASPISTNGGWSSITSVAAPPLLVPNSPMSTPNFGSISSGSSLGASFTSTAANDTTPLHSVLKDPASSPGITNTANAGQTTDWSAGWSGDNSAAGNASISRAGNASTPASNQRYGSNANAGTSTNNSWSGGDSWAQNQPALGAATGATAVSNPNTMPSFANSPAANPSVPQFTGQQTAQNPAFATGNYAGYTPNGTNPAAANGFPNQQNQMNSSTPGTNQFGTNRTGTTETPQWMALSISVLGLAASLAANLYLGVSYLDARQKYQSLVRKTAETFRRVKAVAV